MLLILVFCTISFAYAADNAVGVAGELLTAVNYPGSTLSETTLGDVASDAVRYFCNSDVAIIPGGDFHANLCSLRYHHSDAGLSGHEVPEAFC